MLTGRVPYLVSYGCDFCDFWHVGRFVSGKAFDGCVSNGSMVKHLVRKWNRCHSGAGCSSDCDTFLMQF